jgi:CspA family cold shock protein
VDGPTIKGYGFIAPDHGERNIFIHIRDVVNTSEPSLPRGTVLEYDCEESDKGVKALNAEIID